MSKQEWFDAVESGDLPKVKHMLSEDGSLLHARSRDKETAIIKASENGRLSVVKHLLKCGANPNDADETSAANTALILASFEGHDKVVRHLLRKGATIDKQNSAGTTPLIAAAGEGRTKVVNLLVQKGADTSRTNADGENACDIVQTLFARNKTLKTKLCNLIEKKEKDSLSDSSSSVGGKKTKKRRKRRMRSKRRFSQQNI
jgi:ankyrin repeat protein